MALIICPECGKQFSDKAAACPNCGCLTSEIVKSAAPKGNSAEAEKQMLALVEQTLEKARKASAEYELASDDVQKLAESTNINLLGNTVRQDTSRIVEAAVNACDALYTAYQGLIPTLDGGCRPLLTQNPGAKAVKAVAGTMAWLNEESKIENNYAITFNGANLGNAVKAKYLPNPLNLSIQGYWEAEYTKLPECTEAESFWKNKKDEHIRKTLQAEHAARQRRLDMRKQELEWNRQQQIARQKQQKAEEEVRRSQFASQQDRIIERMEYTRPAKGMFSSKDYGNAYAYISEQGKATLHGTISIRQKNYNPDDVSKMNDLCQIAVNNDGIFGLMRNGHVVMNSSTSEIKSRFGYSTLSTWTEIKKIACTSHCVIGLRNDGTCVGTKYKNDMIGREYMNESDVSAWRDIVDIVCGQSFTAGLKANGTVCYCGTVDAQGVDLHRCRQWNNIILLHANYSQLIGLRKDGSLVQTGDCDLSLVSMAKDIVDIAIVDRKLFVLQSDGRVVGVKAGIIGSLVDNESKGYIIPNLDHVVAIYREKDSSLFVLKENGHLEEYDAENFYRPPKQIATLCSSYSTYQKAERNRIREKEEKALIEKREKEVAERKKREEEALQADRRNKGLCQYCGGELEKKLFGWKCKACGQRKDY